MIDLSEVHDAQELEERAAGGVGPYEREPRTPEMIGAEIRMYVDAGRRITLLCGIEIGRRLVEAKEMMNHGEWLPWLRRETDFSERSAQNYMKVFNTYGAAQLGLFGPETNTQTFADLPISKALAMLSLPESEREDFAAEVGAETISVRELEAKVKERTAEIEAEKNKILRAAQDDKTDLLFKLDTLAEEAEDLQKARDEAEKARKEAEETILRMKQEIEEIEARPRDVAVERDEEAIREAAEKARKEAEKAARERIRELEGQIKLAKATKESLEKELAEAQEKAEAAEKAGGDSAELRKQVENLQKQLSLAAPEVAAFKAAFDRAQDELVHAETALREIRDEEIKEKVRRAFTAMLEGFMERVKE